MRSSNSFVLVAIAALAAAPAAAEILDDVVAKVNGQPLMLSEYKKNLREILDNWQQNMPQVLRDEETVRKLREEVLEQMIANELVAQRADELKVKVYDREIDKGVDEIKERGFRVDPETREPRSDKDAEAALRSELEKEGLSWEKFRQRIEKQIKIRKVYESEVRAKQKEPDEERARKAFELLRKVAAAKSTDTVKGLISGLPETAGQGYAAFGFRLRDLHSERVAVSHILVESPKGSSMVELDKARKKAEGLRERLVKGEDFFEVAKAESDDSESAPRGGDLGFLLRDWFEQPFMDAAFALPVGEISEPVRTNYGYHLIRVREKKASEALNFEKLKTDIKQFLMNMDMQNGITDLVQQLRKKSTVETKLPKG